MENQTQSETQSFISDKTALDSYKKGWQLLRSRFRFFVGVVAVMVLIQLVGETTFDMFSEHYEATTSLFSILFGALIIAPITAGSYWLFLKAVRQDEYEFRDMFVVFERNYRQVVFAQILVSLFAILGFVLLIIPGIIVLVRLSFVQYLVVDRKMLAWDAITTSWEMTKGYGRTLFKMWLLAIPLIIVGLVLLIVGVIPAIAWMGISLAVLYHSIEIETDIEKQDHK